MASLYKTPTSKHDVLHGRYNNKESTTKTPTLDGFNGPGKKVVKSRNVTPSRNMDFKGATEGDRYVPQHSQEQIDFAKACFDDKPKLNTSTSLPTSPETYRAPSISLLRGKSTSDIVSSSGEETSMFVYRREGAPVIHGKKTQNVLYKCMNPSSSVRNAKRVYPKLPTQSLDAPELVSDYYYNILDWSSKQFLAVAIKDKVYTFNALTSETSLFKDFNNTGITVTLLKFSRDGAYLAVGLDNGFIQLFKFDTQQSIRKFGNGNWRICAAAWTSNGLLSFGNRGGIIQTHDSRQRLSFLSETEHHQAEVCGLNWVCDDEFLVSGSCDSLVNVYAAGDAIATNPRVLYEFDDHNSTVKAITQCTIVAGKIIATSGGLHDATIKLWNLSTGELFTDVKTNNQVSLASLFMDDGVYTSAIVFDKYYREMVTAHGGTSNSIITWKYHPQQTEFEAVNEIQLHARPLNMVVSPCNEYIAMTTDSEEISIFHMFQKDERFRQQSLEDRAKQLSIKFNGVRQRIRLCLFLLLLKPCFYLLYLIRLSL